MTILLRRPLPVQDLPLLEVTLDPSPPLRECHHDVDDDDDVEEVDESDQRHKREDSVS